MPLLYATITAVIGSALDMYRSSNLWCWVAGQYQVTRMIFLYGPVWLSFIVTSFCMIKIYCEVRAQEAKTKKYNSSVTSAGRSDLNQRTDHSRRFANQAMFYVLSFWITWLFPTCTRVSQFITGGSSPFVFIALFTIFIPLQGFFNVLVYLRPKYLKFKKRHADKNMCQLILLGCGCSGEKAMRMTVFHLVVDPQQLIFQDSMARVLCQRLKLKVLKISWRKMRMSLTRGLMKLMQTSSMRNKLNQKAWAAGCWAVRQKRGQKE